MQEAVAGNNRERVQTVRTIRSLRLVHAAACEKDFAAYFRAVWPILEPTTPLLWNWHLDLIAEYMEACKLGQIRQLILNLPPRHLKSNEVTVAFPTWLWGPCNMPAERLMFWSYADELAVKHSRDRRTIIESPFYQERWGHRFKLVLGDNRSDRFSNDKRGHMVSNSLLGGGLGEGGNWSITDDANDPIRANSDSERESTNTAYDQKVRQRIDNEAKGCKIILQQRTHDLDLTGHVLSKERAEWTYVRLPATAPKTVYVRFPLSGKKVLRKIGEPLHEARMNRDQLAKKKVAIGTYAYSGQYDQSPSPPGGTIFTRGNWKYYRRLPAKFERTVLYVDSSFKGEEDSCPTAMEAWGKLGADCYLIDFKHGIMNFLEAKKALLQFVAQFNGRVEIVRGLSERGQLWPLVSRHLIEDTANGPAIITSLRKKIPGLVPAKLSFPWSTNQRAVSKIERARAVSPWQESHNLWLPHEELDPRIGGFVDECAAFPKGALADRVDAMTGALIHFMTTDSGEFTGDMAKPDTKGRLTSARKVQSDGEEDPRSTIEREIERSENPRASYRRAKW